MTKAILFDKDGTLFDFQKTWGGWAAKFLKDLSKGDASLFAALGERIQFDAENEEFHPSSPVIAGTPEEGVSLIHPLLPDWSFEGLLEHSNTTAANAPLSQVVPLAPFLDGLVSRGIILGVATNDSVSSARAHLSAVSVETKFNCIIGSDSGYGAKPGPGMCLGFVSETGADPKSTLMVGDSLHDLEAGRAAGMTSVGVLTGLATQEDLAPYADHVLPDISYLHELL